MFNYLNENVYLHTIYNFNAFVYTTLFRLCKTLLVRDVSKLSPHYRCINLDSVKLNDLNKVFHLVSKGGRVEVQISDLRAKEPVYLLYWAVIEIMKHNYVYLCFLCLK